MSSSKKTLLTGSVLWCWWCWDLCWFHPNSLNSIWFIDCPRTLLFSNKLASILTGLWSLNTCAVDTMVWPCAHHHECSIIWLVRGIFTTRLESSVNIWFHKEAHGVAPANFNWSPTLLSTNIMVWYLLNLVVRHCWQHYKVSITAWCISAEPLASVGSINLTIWETCTLLRSSFDATMWAHRLCVLQDQSLWAGRHHFQPDPGCQCFCVPPRRHDILFSA